ncbi:MAG: aldehyde ferredoxin oxidoreductase family protein [Candidatus Thorarchaeota archaeon]
MNGYIGRILEVDLSKRTIESIPINEDIARQFVGGSGYASRLLYDLLDFGTDPLGPSNVLLFMTGPLTGTMAPCTGRHMVCGRSPLTELWGEAHAGGRFGVRLKSSGYDGVLVKGESEKPVYLHINDGQAELQPADSLWGMLTDETHNTLTKDLGRVEVACIGPAGENLVRFAGIVNDERVTARCGLGAVMGSKKLKAIAVEGKHKVSLAEPEQFKELARTSSKTLGEIMTHLRDAGTAMYVDIGADFNDMPIKYFQESEFDDILDLSSTEMKEFLTGRSACYACPIGCGRKVTIPEYDMDNVAGPEYQTIAAFGSNLMISDLKKISLMNRLCNQYGMDTISCGSTIGFATHLCDLGKLDVGLKWSDPERVIELIHEIAKREGLGDDIAEGSKRMSLKYKVPELAIHVKGLEVPNHDPRAFSGMATVYAMASRGASHLEGDMYSVDMGVEARELGIHSGDRLDNEAKGSTAAKAQDFRAFFDTMIMCHFAIVPTENMLRLLNLAVGGSYKLEDILTIGARAVTMKRLINLKLGLQVVDDRLPDPLLRPLPDEATFDFVPDVEKQVAEYYEYRDWDKTTGHPSPKALKNLDIEI